MQSLKKLKALAKKLISIATRLGFVASPSDLAQRVTAEGLTYLGTQKLIRIEQALSRVAKDDVVGDYIEFGVALGGSAILIGKSAQARDARFCGFDVFGQIPAPTSELDDEKSKARYKVIAAGGAHGIGGNEYYGYVDNLFQQVTETFRQHDLQLQPGKIELLKGLFEDTLPTASIDTIAFAHVDCDWYDPVLLCLEFVGPRLAAGGRIVMDDYHDYGGCKKATDEFLQKNQRFRMLRGRNPILIRR